MKTNFIKFFFFIITLSQNATAKNLDIIGQNRIVKIETRETSQGTQLRFQYCEQKPRPMCKYLGNTGGQNFYYSQQLLADQKKYEMGELVASGFVDTLIALGIIAVSGGGGTSIAMAVTEAEFAGAYMGANFALGTMAGGTFAAGAFEVGVYSFKWLKDQFRPLDVRAQYNDVLSLSNNVLNDQDFSKNDEVVLNMAVSINTVLNKIEN
jgi:hypothetical protein